MQHVIVCGSSMTVRRATGKFVEVEIDMEINGS